MESRVLPSKEISEMLAKNFVCLKIDVDNPPPGVGKILTQIQGNTLPFYAYVSPDGAFIRGTSGFRDQAEFKSDLEVVLRLYKPKVASEAEKKSPPSEGAPERITSSHQGMVLRSILKTVDPWERQEVGAWYRFKTIMMGKEEFEDVGLKSRESSSNTLILQHFRDGQASPAEEALSKHIALKVIGEETLQIRDRSFTCEVRCPVSEKGVVDETDREWTIKGGKYAGALLRVESPKRTLSAKKVWDHLLRVKGSEFDCVVVEADSKAGDKIIAIKTWYCASLPSPMRLESEEKSVTLVDFGPAWSKRTPFPGVPQKK